MGAASKQLLDLRGVEPVPPSEEGEIISMVPMDLLAVEVICGEIIRMVPVLCLARIVIRE